MYNVLYVVQLKCEAEKDLQQQHACAYQQPHFLIYKIEFHSYTQDDGNSSSLFRKFIIRDFNMVNINIANCS
jgi:hypothetical protein